MGNKITIIGSGSVGSTIAYTLAVQGTASEIVMIDINNKLWSLAKFVSSKIGASSNWFGATSL